jgi:hypothetical protein
MIACRALVAIVAVLYPGLLAALVPGDEAARVAGVERSPTPAVAILRGAGE